MRKLSISFKNEEKLLKQQSKIMEQSKQLTDTIEAPANRKGDTEIKLEDKPDGHKKVTILEGGREKHVATIVTADEELLRLFE